MEVGIEVDGFVFFSTGVMRFSSCAGWFGAFRTVAPDAFPSRTHGKPETHGSLARGFVCEPVLFKPTEQNYTTQRQASQKRFVQDHPGVLTPKMEKNAEWRVFFSFFHFMATPHSLQDLSSPTHIPCNGSVES